jgi:hypothetical protein
VTEPARLLRRMVDDLIDSGELISQWHEAFSAVPRHVFIPDLVWRETTPSTVRLTSFPCAEPTIRATTQPCWRTGLVRRMSSLSRSIRRWPPVRGMC